MIFSESTERYSNFLHESDSPVLVEMWVYHISQLQRKVQTQLLNCHVLQTTWQHEEPGAGRQNLAQSATQWWSCKEELGWSRTISICTTDVLSAVVFVVGEGCLNAL